MNAYYMISQGVPITLAFPKEGAVLGVDTVAIMKGSKNSELAYKFINALYDPEVQAEIAKIKKGQPRGAQRQDRSGNREAARRFHHRRAMEAADQHRRQAARREDRGMAQMVRREHHELMASTGLLL